MRSCSGDLLSARCFNPERLEAGRNLANMSHCPGTRISSSPAELLLGLSHCQRGLSLGRRVRSLEQILKRGARSRDDQHLEPKELRTKADKETIEYHQGAREGGIAEDKRNGDHHPFSLLDVKPRGRHGPTKRIESEQTRVSNIEDASFPVLETADQEGKPHGI